VEQIANVLDKLRSLPRPTRGGALEGIKVLELSQFIAGPVCGCILADHGAEVIKIERPGGEDARRIGPFVNGESLYFATYNRNKMAVSLDLKDPEGRDLFRALAAQADVVVENYRPGVMDRLDIGYEDLKTGNPALVFVSISGFGQTGPSRDLPAFDQIVQALSGVMYLGGDEGSGPQKLGISVSDYAAGLQGAVGALLALFVRERVGEGQFVDVSLFDSLAFMLETSLSTYVATGERPPRVGNARPGSVPGNTYECSNGWVYVAATSDRIWERLLAALDEASVAELQALEANAERVEARARVDAVIGTWCAARKTADVVDLMAAAGVPCAPVRNVDELLEDPHVLARRTVEVMDHPSLGEHVVPGVPVKLSATPGGLRRRAARVGEHNDEVFASLGVPPERLAELRARGVI
jgi:CoA:oxalate CoA-transferase